MRTTWSFHTAGELHFGRGAADQTGELVARHRWQKALVITDATLLGAGVVQPVIDSLQAAGINVEVFADGQPEPEISVAVKAAARAREFDPNTIIGVGGGSNLDLAKVTAVAHAHGGEPRDFFGFDKVPGPVTPVVAVPTTAGTGSEVSHSAVLTDTANEMKVSTLSQLLRPAIAVVDPLLTLSCPKQVTAESGIDALTHAIEAFTAADYFALADAPPQARAYAGRFPLSDCLAEKAIALVGEHLRAAVSDGSNEAAREAMALAATLAGMAFSNAGVALVHALEYPLGGALHCSHGGGNGMLLPYVMRFNLPERIDAFGRIAQLLGCDVSGATKEEAAEAAIAAVIQLRADIGIPHTIGDYGGTTEQLPEFARKSFAIERLVWLNPRRATEADLLGILQTALG